MKPLGAAEAYRLWAPSYDGETAVSALDDQLVSAMTLPPRGLRLLDAGCGTGRRLEGTGAASAVGVDLSSEMLMASARRWSEPATAAMVGDLRALPLPDRSFDLVWCRLAIGHVPDCAPVYAELARVADVGAQIVVTDFHSVAHAAGHRRTFRLGDAVHEVEHYLHDLTAHLAAAAAAGLLSLEVREGTVGPAVRGFYERAGRMAAYRQDYGLPLVLALSFRRAA